MNRPTVLVLSVLTALALTIGAVVAWPISDAPAAVAVAAPEPVAGVAAPEPAAVVAVPAPAVTAAPPVVAAPAPPAVRVESAPAFSGTTAYQHVDALANGIGSRVAGSDTQVQTHQYLMARFQELGYQVELQPFPITAYQDRGSKLILGGAGGSSIQANTLQYSTAGVADAVIVEVGLGRPEEYEAANVAGKIVLVNRGDTRFVDKVSAAATAGAVAVVIVNNVPGSFNGSLIGISSIPAIGISQEDGARIRESIRAGQVTVRVEVDASTQQSTGHNVVATRPGGPQTLVIGGHIDSVAAGPGANDNASGTAVVLELARVMATRPTPFTVKLIGFDAEEIGLIGSNYYVSQLSEEQRRAIVGMINLDMVGVGENSRIGGTEAMVKLGQSAAGRIGLPVVSLGEASASDHASFTRAGIPGLFIHRSSDPNYHSPNDKAQFIDANNLQIAGQLALEVIGALERGE